MKRVLVTGACGFVGKALCQYLTDHSYYVRGLVREVRQALPDVYYSVVELDGQSSLATACRDIDCVVHLACRAHVINERSNNPSQSYRKVNCEATLQLARNAIDAGVRRFIFISSIGVNGAQTFGKAFDESSTPHPRADYAISKFEAEQALKSLMASTQTELVIIRPPLVYDYRAPGNFQRLLKWVGIGMPMPFGAVENSRSMVALDNLVDFIGLCIEHPRAANQLFLVSDGVEVSTKEIVHYVAKGMGLSPLMLSLSPKTIQKALEFLGKQSMFTQLCGSLVVDSSKARKLLEWHPLVFPTEALKQTGKLYKEMLGCNRG